MGYFQAVVLGVLQGLTEFLPVSSSAHLILARALLGWDAADLGLAFDVACHVGTLGAVGAFFRSDLFALARAVPGLFRRPVWPADDAGPWWPAQLALALAVVFAPGDVVLAMSARMGYRAAGVERLALAWLLGAGVTRVLRNVSAHCQ